MTPILATLLAAGLLLAAPLRAAPPEIPVEEPAGFRLTDYRAPTPPGLAGATTLDTGAVRALLERGGALPIYVQKLDRSSLPGAPWLLSKPFRQIPGSVWLPNVGLGAPDPATLDWFARHLERLTGGDRAHGLLFYCLSDCWLSWNTAKRAVLLGYTRVHWYPAGVDGWAEAGLPTEDANPLPGPQPAP
ncbi:rhodanese-like domain-containing protein [Azospirillum doebereinerae]|uniref:PQQ-dependent catabolism-associated CXXCW motif protein n=1 Tax=Azospirillum doebereinerae TaxID=92933 RepID=A0A3S0VE61_9PROT|nr:rhodanese-like domain-containing protein [Azospirillum doebereinerae]MCG5242654.1 PQQ-dependent catabolism-associated CXXCW motif protein [Azospirillum doebereinerae]RUQ62206.1 PQQ-dependent catabolism-associated CXXCW motif protein [Azospirillum doebereinerae]